MVLDFDVSQSFGRERGNSGRWVMSPVITATEVAASGAAAGSVAVADGVSIPACGGGARSVMDFIPVASADEAVQTGHVASDSTFAIAYLAPGSYTISAATCEAVTQ